MAALIGGLLTGILGSGFNLKIGNDFSLGIGGGGGAGAGAGAGAGGFNGMNQSLYNHYTGQPQGYAPDMGYMNYYSGRQPYYYGGGMPNYYGGGMPNYYPGQQQGYPPNMGQMNYNRRRPF